MWAYKHSTRLKALLNYGFAYSGVLPNVQAMILAAGLGSRLRPITDVLPKPLIAVAGKPLIVHHIERLAAMGCKKIVINVHHFAEMMQQHLGDGQRWGVSIVYSYEPALLETGGGLIKACHVFDDAPILVISADIFTDFPFQRLYQVPLEFAHLVMVPNPSFHPAGDYSCEQGRIVHASQSTYTYANIGLFSPRLLLQVKQSGAFPLRVIIEQALETKQATGEVYLGQWYNIGTREELDNCEKTVCSFGDV